MKPLLVALLALLAAAAWFLLPRPAAPDAGGIRPASQSLVAEDALSAQTHGMDVRSGPERRALGEPQALGAAEEAASGHGPGFEERGHAFLVSSDLGQVVAEAQLRLLRVGHGAPVGQVRTNRDGEAFLDARPGDEVLAEAGGHLPLRVTLGSRPWSEPYVLVLESATRYLRGRVLDESGGPVAGARLRLSRVGWQGEAASDAHGLVHVAIPKLLELPFVAELSLVHADGFFQGQGSTIEVSADDLERELELRLERWARARVRVLDAGGAPIQGATLQLAGPPSAADRVALPAGILGMHQTGVEGEVELRLPPGIEWWALLFHPDFEPGELVLGETSPGERIEREGILARRAQDSTRRFQVVDSVGTPVPSARVSLHFEDGSTLLRLDSLARFSVSPRPPGWKLVVKAEGFGFLERAEEQLGPVSAAVERLELQAGEPELLVEVAHREGGHASGLLVSAREGSEGLASSTSTDEQGLARFYGLNPDRAHRITLGLGRPGQFSPDRAAEWVPDPAAFTGVHPRGARLRITLVPASSIAGVLGVRVPAGKFANLSCIANPGTADEELLFTVSTALDPTGGFYFSGLPPGHYRLWMELPTPDGGLSRALATWELGRAEALQAGVVEVR